MYVAYMFTYTLIMFSVRIVGVLFGGQLLRYADEDCEEQLGEDVAHIDPSF